MIEKKKLEKWHLMSHFIKNNLDLIKKYETIWFPDDDLDTNCDDINKLFEIHKKYNLLLSQPSVDGYVSYDIERKVENSILRFTNFVEIFCPMMSLPCLMFLLKVDILISIIIYYRAISLKPFYKRIKLN